MNHSIQNTAKWLIDIKLNILCLMILFFLSPLVGAHGQNHGSERNILQREIDAINLQGVLITNDSWVRRPGYKDRNFWNNLPADTRGAYVNAAEKYVDYSWP